MTDAAKPNSASVEQVAQAFGVTPRRVQQLVKEGMPIIGRGKYNLGQCFHWYVRFLQKALETRSTIEGNTITNLTAERTRQARAQAHKLELENAKRRGEVMLVSQAMSELLDWSNDMVNRLEGLSGRVANEFAGITDPSIIRRRVNEEVDAIRAGSAEHIRKLGSRTLTTAGELGSNPAEAAPKRKRVGRSVSDPAARKRRARTVPE